MIKPTCPHCGSSQEVEYSHMDEDEFGLEVWDCHNCEMTFEVPPFNEVLDFDQD